MEAQINITGFTIIAISTVVLLGTFINLMTYETIQSNMIELKEAGIQYAAGINPTRYYHVKMNTDTSKLYLRVNDTVISK